MKILAIDASKYGVKWALFQLPQGDELASGLVEVNGEKESYRRFHWWTLNDTKRVKVADHEKAVQLILAELLSFSVIDSLEDIDSIGHRVVAGGEYFKESAIVPREKKAKAARLGTYTLMNNFTQFKIIQIFQQLLPQKLNVAVFDHAIYRKKQVASYSSAHNQVPINRQPFVHTLNSFIPDGRMIAEDVYEMVGEKVRV